MPIKYSIRRLLGILAAISIGLAVLTHFLNAQQFAQRTAVLRAQKAHLIAIGGTFTERRDRLSSLASINVRAANVSDEWFYKQFANWEYRQIQRVDVRETQLTRECQNWLETQGIAIHVGD